MLIAWILALAGIVVVIKIYQEGLFGGAAAAGRFFAAFAAIASLILSGLAVTSDRSSGPWS
jgi:hypothetical protein